MPKNISSERVQQGQYYIPSSNHYTALTFAAAAALSLFASDNAIGQTPTTQPNFASSSLDRVKHGLKDGKYYYRFTVKITVGPEKPPVDADWRFSFCFDKPREMCLTGKEGTFTELKPGTVITSQIPSKGSNQYKVYLDDKCSDDSKSCTSVRGLEPKVSVTFSYPSSPARSEIKQTYRLSAIGDL